MRILALTLLVTIGCGRNRHEPVTPKVDSRLALLEDEYKTMLNEARDLRDPHNGWLVSNDCDGMLWTGKYAASLGVDDVNIRAAEIETGRFDRRPSPRCWIKENGHNDSKTTWSRDMSVGLFAYAFNKKDLSILEDHARYGDLHGWIMGEPVADGRVIYTPAVIGALFQIIYRLGGVNDPRRVWPNVYAEGLDDYQAHLQMMDIWMAIEVDGTTYHGSITDIMLKRVKEHVKREPFNPLFNYIDGLFTGDMSEAITLILREDHPVGTYVRCGEKRKCVLAERIFVASQLIQWLKRG